MEIRVATEQDAEAIRNIYAPYVEKTAITFEYDVPSVEEFRHRIATTLREYPYLVAIEDGEVVGYAYAGPFYGRAAYKHSAEVSVYVSENQRGHGTGKLLYQQLESALASQNVFVLYACITAAECEGDPYVTDGSLRFHEKMGYRLTGKHNQCGYKLGRWYSVVWMEKSMADRPAVPEPFVPFPAL